MLLVGKKIKLRQLREKDLPQLKKWLNNHEIQWLTEEEYPVAWDDEEIWRLYSKAFRGKRKMYGIETKEGKLVGEIWLDPLRRGSGYGEMVIGIDPEEQGKGYGKEAVELIMSYGFNELELHRIEIKVYSFNHKAYQLYKSCGFIEEGRRRERIWRDGVYHDEILMSILKREYLQLRERSRIE